MQKLALLMQSPVQSEVQWQLQLMQNIVLKLWLPADQGPL